MKNLHVKIITALWLCSFSFAGCENKDVQPYSAFDVQKLASCSESTSWDYATTKSNITGLWEWQYVLCCGERSKLSKDDAVSKGLKIEFNDDGTGVIVDYDAISGFRWDLQPVGDSFELSTDPLILQLEGRIVICDEILITDANYKDGAANYYKKK